MAADHARPAGAVLGPGSLLVRLAGDWRALLPGPAAGLMQLMDPALGQGVEDHSAFFTEPFDRINRSIPQIWAVLLAPDGEERGLAIRDVHRDIKGRLPSGSRYHALDPDTFWWAHATFTWEIFRSVELFHGRQLSPVQREQVYAESVSWYQRYGVSDRPVPDGYEAFRARFREICVDRLHRTVTFEHALRVAAEPLPGRPGPRPGLLGSVAAPVLGPVLAPVRSDMGRLLLFGSLPGLIRERFELPWSPFDAARFSLLRASLRNGFRLVPPSLNRMTFENAQRRVGARTRPNRRRPAA